jgi:hypothetical protein
MSATTKNTRSLSFSGLGAVRNARSRIFVSGSDPIFGRRRTGASPAATLAMPAIPVRAVASFEAPPLWDLGLLDRLQPRLTRFHD